MPKRPYAPKHHISKGTPTARFGGGYIIFRADLLTKDLQKVIEITAKTIGGKLVAEAKKNIRAIKFHQFPVRLAGEDIPATGLRKTTAGYTRTDATRKQALLNSIILDNAVRTTATRVSVAVKTMANNFKDSHIGIYYEHGTGTYANGGYTKVRGARYEHNPLRTGKEIYTRPGQTWIDLGGNMRISTAREKKKLRGFAVEPYRWFARAVDATNKQFAKVFSDELKYLDIRKYLQIKNKIIIGGRRHSVK